jgi:hypothetical protein
MTGMLPFESPSVRRCWTVLTPYISVEATAKGFIAYRSLESLNDPGRRTRPIETSRDL